MGNENLQKELGKILDMARTSGSPSEEILKQERLRRQKQRESLLKEWERKGLLRSNILLYASPWEEMIKNFGRNWTVLENWTPDCGNFYLYGPNGVGKSAAMRYLLARSWWKGMTIADISAFDFCSKCLGFEYVGIFKEIKRRHVVLLDDIDKPSWTSKTLVALWELLDYRAEKQLPTLVTANMNTTKLHEVFCQVVPENTSIATAALKRLRPLMSIFVEGKDLRDLKEFGTWERKK